MRPKIIEFKTDRISNLLFTLTEISQDNLIYEGANKNKIIGVGYIMYDATLFDGKKICQEKADNLN